MKESDAKEIALEIVTPTGATLKRRVHSVNLPAHLGSMGILANHQPIISLLQPGIVSFTLVEGGSEKVGVSGGFFEFNNNYLTVLADLMVTKKDISPKFIEKYQGQPLYSVKKDEFGSREKNIATHKLAFES